MMMWLQTFYKGGRSGRRAIDSDPDANYAQTVKIDLSSLEPIVPSRTNLPIRRDFSSIKT